MELRRQLVEKWSDNRHRAPYIEPMAVFAVVSKVLQPALAARIAQSYPELFEWSDRAWIIQTNDNATKIARNLGVSERDASGQESSEFGHVVVLQLAPSYWGYGPTPIWEWMKSAFERVS